MVFLIIDYSFFKVSNLMNIFLFEVLSEGDFVPSIYKLILPVMIKNFNLPKNHKKRIIIVGAGFAGLKLARMMARSKFKFIYFF